MDKNNYIRQLFNCQKCYQYIFTIPKNYKQYFELVEVLTDLIDS